MSTTLRLALVGDINVSLADDDAVEVCQVVLGSDCSAYDLVLASLDSVQSAPSVFRQAPALFVLLPNEAARADAALWQSPNIVGFGCMTDPLTHAEFRYVIGELQERQRLQATEHEHMALSEHVWLDANAFISHYSGVMRQFYRDCKDLLLSLTPREATAFHNPFQGVSPRYWLDFYGYHTFGAYLDNATQANELWEKVVKPTVRRQQDDKKAREQALQTFERIFLRPTAFPSPGPILLLGETGVGKTIVAQMIYQRLTQHKPAEASWTPPFTQVNCAGLGNLLQSELFGAMTGAFTSAAVTNPGKIVASYGGVLFLDEIGTMSHEAQEKLLVYLDHGEVTPEAWLGDPLHVPVQVVAATNVDLLDEVQKGRFRADLYYRFDRHLSIPPLRQRGRDDLELLLHSLLTQDAINPPCGPVGRSVQGVSMRAWDKLLQHDYPGNFRELRNVLREGVRSTVRLRDRIIRSADIAFEKSPLPPQQSVAGIIKTCQDGQEWFLLRFNPYWYYYFLIGGRFEAVLHTFENALSEELNKKLGLRPEQYDLVPVDAGQEVRLIQYSARDKMLKHYTFHLYGVMLREDPWQGQDLTRLGLLWATPAHIQQERGPAGEKISPTVREIASRAGAFAPFPASPLRIP